MSRGSNSSGLRRYNERVLLAALRQRGTASKSDLARSANLTAQAVTRIVDDLEETGLVLREGRRLGGKGQPSTLYALNPRGAYAIGVKVGRRGVEVLLMDFGGRILHKLEYEREMPGPAFVLEHIESGMAELVAKLSPQETRKLMGVGVAMPWFMGAWSRELEISPERVREWEEVNFAEELQARTSLPVFFENDCSAAAAAEQQFGDGEDNFLYVYLGTFIGGGLILNGNLEPGVHGNAGALASMPVPRSSLDSVPAPAGPFDALYNRASLFGLRRHLNAHGIDLAFVSDLETVMDTARPLVQEWMEDCADALVFALLSAVGILDLEAIVIDAVLPRYLLDELVDMVSRRMRQAAQADLFVPVIRAGILGADAVAVGGAILPFYSNFAPDKTVLLKGGVPERVSV
ncbi:ROK family transcriptional regulator [Microbulbifer rhizosphaerae]|uniref:Putative NBD/HSP70 family sugar kinase n=1 Tax=Microbulbifer rhizosphaerae TaxID=1562603 RepID=A0A7W4Z8W3_9GAMM|nr:ROK family transcriptional regulator [Microbulbifer rhizosphaerae]MBB3059590.1 putative NBD/HSP70 family sugar kinase [Microbulbifer rhizosphaerae]